MIMDEEDLLLKQEVIIVEKKDEYYKLKHKRLLICNLCIFAASLGCIIYVYVIN